ncbi:GGDEF domain-containing protein [Methylophaga sp. OBS4]|uniref:GGDEF domain-containing protein n=1 Tax=Methylophaga sp. OBS4 TaxID=2991935 RepID=UPI002256CDBD|nr:GGDEF domain-containing protein [Methylophaga sp. OBS4]MCX4187507.1 GGDEF domain-containing protein [Methylophaga sp. OBS4]
MLEFLDAKTIFVLTALFSALITVVFFSIHRGVYGVVNGVLSFAWGYGFFSLFALLLFMRGLIHPLLSVVLADTALILALLMMADGICRIKNYPIHTLFYRWYLTLCLLIFSWFTFIDPSFTVRVLVVILCVVVIFSWILLMLVRQSLNSWRLGEWILSVALLVSIVAGVLWAMFMLTGLDDTTALSILAYQGTQAHYLTINLLATVFIALGLIVITQDDLRRDLERLASYDALTGVLTRRVILNLLDKAMATVARYGQPMALMILDLDHFKHINDNFGHRVGDAVLVQVMKAIEGALRKDTFIGRYGGEEFLVIMPDTNQAQLREVSERIRRVTAETRIRHQDQTIHCTISIGGLIIDADNVHLLYDPVTYADRALYQAKVQGRNQVVIADAEYLSTAVLSEPT